ncbi:uncharacterized protein Triagg1_3124 [Trichoderma aggressivum f. europaeum]|uniref:Peptidase S8/S53 domain-containing protein n=1 Tax=Trichoderma aggressivum f. europaeum TaxID=173218 RepID=A0AAE1IGD6_9HYPO|nr:hypothetical protein Triagg1_3124 [Trichoderma aggressivum f. europaeum]
MAWFKNLALFFFAVTPYVTARPLKTARGCSALDVEALEPEAKYIVTLHSNISPSEFQSHIAKINVTYHRNSLNDEQNRPSGVERTYAIGGYRAYSGVFDKDTIAVLWNDTDVSMATRADESVYSNPNGCLQVEEIERDEYFTVQRKLVTQRHAPWGLAALSSKKPGAKSYRYDKSAGNGTFAYVVDSGIFTKHEEFGGRATVGYSVDPGVLSDNSGHGTHVSGIIAGKTFGVVKQAELIGVKVLLDDSGYISDVLDGFQWAVQDIVLKNRQSRSVINLSVGGPHSFAMNQAVDAAFDLGVLSVVAAGNEASPARFTSPASARSALTVGAIDIEWNSCDFSNFGPEVNIQAPGLDVESAFIATVNATATLSGTSMAAPHVAGLALYLAALEKTVDAKQLRDRILELARGGQVKDLASETPNLIAHNVVLFEIWLRSNRDCFDRKNQWIQKEKPWKFGVAVAGTVAVVEAGPTVPQRHHPEPDLERGYNIVDWHIYSRLTTVWKAESRSWSEGERRDFVGWVSRARVTERENSMADHPLAEHMRCNAPSWGHFVILRVMFGASQCARQSWWGEFKGRYGRAGEDAAPGVVPGDVDEVLRTNRMRAPAMMKIPTMEVGGYVEGDCGCLWCVKKAADKASRGRTSSSRTARREEGEGGKCPRGESIFTGEGETWEDRERRCEREQGVEPEEAQDGDEDDEGDDGGDDGESEEKDEVTEVVTQATSFRERGTLECTDRAERSLMEVVVEQGSMIETLVRLVERQHKRMGRLERRVDRGQRRSEGNV